jgi:hypothetical protein
MIDYNENSIESTEAEFEFPPPARFDEIASENAKPVQPIPTSGVAVWIQGAHYARQMLTRRTKALALVLSGGLAIGTLGGTMLVKERSSSPDAAPTVEESIAETTAAQEGTKNSGLNEGTPAAEAGAMPLQGARQTSSRIRHRRIDAPVQRAQRAYRVGVIRQ